MTPQSDQDYVHASLIAFGRSFALMFVGLVENGMTRLEALEVVKAYAAALAANSPLALPPDEEDKRSG